MKVLEYHTQSVSNSCNKNKHIFEDYFFLHIHKTEVPFTEFYDDETRDIVYNAYKEDFKHFNYDYEY